MPHSHTAGPTTDVSGFLTENIARYRQAVKEKFPERFAPEGERALYKANENQIELDFSRPPAIPLANTPENFKQNFQAIAGEFKTDTIEAARFLLRAMPKEDREAALAGMRVAGCTDRESYHKYLYGLLPSDDKAQNNAANELEYNTFNEALEKHCPHLHFAAVENGYYLYPEQIAQGYEYDTKRIYVNVNKSVTAGGGGWKPMEPEHEKQYRELEDAWDNMARGGGKNEIDFFNDKLKVFGSEEKLKQANEPPNPQPPKELVQDKKTDKFPSHFYEEGLRKWFIPVEGGMREIKKKEKELEKQGKYKHLMYAMTYGLFAVPEEDKEEWDQARNDEYERLHGDIIIHAGDYVTGADETTGQPLRGKVVIEDPYDAVTVETDNGERHRVKWHGIKKEKSKIELRQEEQGFQSKPGQEYRPYGAWTDFASRLSVQERERYNQQALAVLEKAGEGPISGSDKAVLRRYSGFGGIADSSERGVLYDYYTSPPIARLAWRLLEKSGTIHPGAAILEPSCGTGVFFEYAPRDKNLSFTGVELDSRTARVAQRLHSGETIEILNQSFEAFNLSAKAETFDHVIGNAPFGERGAALASLDLPEEKSLDNYFTGRSIDRLKENGTMALIVAPGVLENTTNEAFRLSLNKKAQLVGAVKLPDRSFRHTHTQAMPDILLFRKYPKDIEARLSALDDASFRATPFYDHDFASGTYFAAHPLHIAGTLSKGTGQWGSDEVKGDIMPETLEHILSSFTPAAAIPEEIFEQAREQFPLSDDSKKSDILHLSGEELKQLENKTLKGGALKVFENRVYLLAENYSWGLVSEDKRLAGKIADIKAISNYVHAIQEDMQAEKDAAVIRMKQKQCRTYLLGYSRKYGAYPADDVDLKRFTRERPAVQGVYEALLPVDDPLLVSDNVYRKQAEIHDGHNAAVAALLQLREKMKDADEETIRAFFPDTADGLIAEMREHKDIFYTPGGFYQLREDFISGDAWKKIDELRNRAENALLISDWEKEKMRYGASELEKAVGWTAIEDADFSPRSSWVPAEAVREWASSEEALGQIQLGELAKNSEGKWGIASSGIWQEYPDPLIYYLNGQKQRSRYYDTEAYAKEHDELFRSFICSHEQYRARLESEYNRKFKTHIAAPVKTYPVAIAGWKAAGQGGKDVKPHQWQSVHHLYRNQGGISALGTGFGKTVTSIALMSLLRQEGKAHRIFLQVPNNKVKDWIQELRDAMPSLKIASIDPEEPGYADRAKRYAKYQAMARSDADIILMPESSASEIQLSAENDALVTQKVSMLYKMEKEGGTARQQQMAALKGEGKADSGKTNATVCFEDFGCDALFADEAHRYKNLFSSTLSREIGLNDGRQSAKAMSLYKKASTSAGRTTARTCTF